MIERALGLKLSKPDALADAGRIYALCSLDPSLDDKTKAEYVRRAYNLYVDASLAAPNSGYVYSSCQEHNRGQSITGITGVRL
jgi:alpha-mannosidase